MTQKPRIVIDTNKHGIRRETNLDKVGKKKYDSNRRRVSRDSRDPKEQGSNTNS
jgi:hypothetical protein